VDRDAEWARTVARRLGVTAYAHHGDLAGRVDAALVATPNATHADIAATLLASGVHVLCEKPVATTRAELDRMYGAARAGKTRLMAGHCLRFAPNVAALRRMVRDGWLGAVETVTGGIGSPYQAGTQRTDFRRSREQAGGGVLADLGIHLIDLALWLVARRVETVRYDAAASQGWEVETDADVVLEFADGTRAALACSFTHVLENRLEVRGAEGWASIPLYQPTELALFTRRARACRLDGSQRILLPEASMYDRQLEHFCDAIRGREDFLVAPDEVYRGVEILERCYAPRQAA
jgi:predicted dehydrogenase